MSKNPGVSTRPPPFASAGGGRDEGNQVGGDKNTPSGCTRRGFGGSLRRTHSIANIAHNAERSREAYGAGEKHRAVLRPGLS